MPDLQWSEPSSTTDKSHHCPSVVRSSTTYTAYHRPSVVRVGKYAHACTRAHSLHSLTFPVTTGLKVGILFLKVSSGTNLVTNTLDADVEQGCTEDGNVLS